MEDLGLGLYGSLGGSSEAVVTNTTTKKIIKDSTNGNVIYLKSEGYTEQKQLAFDGLVTTTTSGIKNTNPIPCKQGDEITVTVSGATISSVAVADADGNAQFAIPYEEPQATVTFAVEVDIDGIIIDVRTTATKMEVKVNGSAYAAPSPNNPIHIGASADKGYFDGVLRQGLYLSTDGSFSSATHFICSANKISCKENDSIVVQYEKNVKNIRATFYKVDGTFISTLGVTNIDTNKIEVIAPTESDYFHISIGLNSGDSLLVADAKHICVTINGQYALRVKSVNRNLCPTFEKSVGANASYYTDSFSVKGDSTYTISFIKERISGSTISNNNLYGYAKVLEYDEKMNLLGTVSGTVASLPSGIHKFVNQITTKPQTKHIAIDFNNNNGESALNTKVYNVQVEEGTVATPFVEHQESEALIPVSSPLYEGDFIEVYADGSGREYRVNKEHKVTKWGYFADVLTNSKEARTSMPSDCKKGSKFYCNIATFSSVNTWGQDTVGLCCYYITAEYNHIAVRIPVDATETDYPCKFVYELATPTITPLTAEQVAEFLKLRTYKGVTYVTADGEVVMRYYVDNDSGEMMAMLQSQINALNEKINILENNS